MLRINLRCFLKMLYKSSELTLVPHRRPSGSLTLIATANAEWNILSSFAHISVLKMRKIWSVISSIFLILEATVYLMRQSF